MSAQPAPDTGPVERLLEHNKKILELREDIRWAELRNRLMAGFGAGVFLMLLAIAIPTAITWQKYDLGPINTVLVILALVFAAGFTATVNLMKTRRHPRSPTMLSHEQTARYSVGEMQLLLELALEHRLMEAVPLDVPVRNRQHAYKDSIPEELDKLRRESRRYRRRHNFFQMFIIIGSIGNAGAQAFSDTAQPLKSIIIGLTMVVAVAAGVSGYYKFRERSFNLQQTADSIEENTNAFHLGLAPYDSSDPAVNLGRLTDKVEKLRVEQRRREQQLDQPHEGNGDPV
ncbi:DUF4231 domain-containing protein [Streptomyces sp. NPDC015350]|uniref:DUF4231 domain-containing protein n=1 Tax=Streptomyces sp. NPDC015350 TaxID=3364955 RepID=UPI0036FBE59C